MSIVPPSGSGSPGKITLTLDRTTTDGVASGTDYDDPDVNGLDGPTSVRVSPDGAAVYVSSCFDTAVVTFERDAVTGKLTFLESISPPEFSGEQSLAVSPDGAHLYVADNGGVGVLAVMAGNQAVVIK